ncbi:MAG TPA: hypothetical protein VIT88_10230, partial [Pyrinomonadaceae bacterium]
WEIKKTEIEPSTLDFGSSGQGTFPVFQLLSEGIKLINALELVDWDPEETQFLICEECGYPHCKSRDWVSVRKSGSLVLMLPASSYVCGETEDKEEYSPPSYLRTRGIPYLEFSTYERLRTQHSSFPSIDSIQPLNLKEATLLFQWNAPDQVLGEPPVIQVRADIVVGSSEGDYSEHLLRMENLIASHYKTKSLAQLRPLQGSEQVISLYLDSVEFREWKALVFDGSEYLLLVDSRFVIDQAEAN